MVLDVQSGIRDRHVFYASGNSAAMETFGKEGRTTCVFTDTEGSQTRVLAQFDSQGLGSVTYRNGNPAILSSEKGYSIYSKEGNLVEAGRWPRKRNDNIHIDVTEAVQVDFMGRRSITVTVMGGDGEVVFQCGEAPKRTDTYLDSGNVLSREGGKVQLDVGAIRDRFKRTGHLYGVAGPNSMVTARPGLGSLRETIRSLNDDNSVKDILRELDEAQARLHSIETLPKAMFGTTRRTTKTVLSPEDLGNVTLSRTQEHLFKSLTPKIVTYKRRRAHVPYMPQSDLPTKIWGSSYPADTLMVMCCVSTWIPASRRAAVLMEETANALEQGRSIMTSAAGKAAGVAATSSSDNLRSGGSARLERGPGQPAPAAAASTSNRADERQAAAVTILRPYAGRVQLYFVDMSEGSTIQSKFQFRQAPMWLLFFNGRVVSGTSNVWTTEDLARLVRESSEKGLKKSFLPENFSFGFSDSQLLDPLRSTMLSLR